MSKRFGMATFVIAIVAAAVVGLFYAPWHHAHLTVFSAQVVPLSMWDALPASMVVPLLLVELYFFARVLFTGLLLVLAEKHSRIVAWYTPAGAHIQGALALAAGVALNLVPPTYGTLLEPDPLFHRGWGGSLLVVANLAAHLAIFLISRDSQLARTQIWTDDSGDAPPRRRIRAPRQQRPLVKSPPPLAPSSAVGGDPFRGGQALGVAARIVKPQTTTTVPRADDDDAQPPKLLV